MFNYQSVDDMLCHFRQSYHQKLFVNRSKRVLQSFAKMANGNKVHVNSKRPISTLPVEKLEINENSFIAYRRYSPPKAANDIGVVFFQGLMSNMNGSKAQFLERYCREKGLNYVCFDYVGHGYSSGKFEEFSIGLWKRNALDVLNKLTCGEDHFNIVR